jgi:hypothetical protein
MNTSTIVRCLAVAFLLSQTVWARGGGGCLAADTLVATPNGSERIASLRPGDSVASFGGGEPVDSRVVALYEAQADCFLQIKTKSASMNVTSAHLVSVGGGSFMEAGRIRPGDDVEEYIGGVYSLVEVSSVKSYDQPVPVYNLLVEGLSTYSANSFVVHNKGCFLPDTPVTMADGTQKMISDVSSGDALRGFTYDGAIVNATIDRIFTAESDGYYVVATVGHQVRVTAEHPFYVGDGVFKVAGELKAGDVIYVFDRDALTKETVASLEYVPGKVTVFNLRTDWPNTYFANFIAVHNKGGGGCFSAGTKVGTPAGNKNIEALKVGDEVTSVGEDGTAKRVKVLGTYSTSSAILRIATSKRSVSTTAEHPFKTSGGFKAASELSVGDEVTVFDGASAASEKITSVEYGGEETVYNLRVGEPDTYTANGFLVHNKGGGGGSGGSSDPYDYQTSCGILKTLTMANGSSIYGSECIYVKYYHTKTGASGLQACAALTKDVWSNCSYAAAFADLSENRIKCAKEEICGGFGDTVLTSEGVLAKVIKPPGLIEQFCPPLFIILWVGIVLMGLTGRIRGSNSDEDLDYCYPASKIDGKVGKTAKVLEYLHGIDSVMWDLKAMRKTALETFMLLQKCWQTREYGPMQPLLMADLYQQHLAQLESMRRNHEIDMIADLKVHRVEIVQLRHYAKKSMQEFTALIEASARDYYVDDRTVKFLRGDQDIARFQEFWVFQRQDDRWLLREINQTRESSALKEENFVEDLTPDQMKNIIGGQAGQADARAPDLEETLSRKGERIHRMLNFLAASDKGWGEESLKTIVRKSYVELLAGFETRDPSAALPLLTDDMAAAYSAQLARMSSEDRSAEYRNICVRKVDIVLVRNYADNGRDEFTARVAAHAQKIEKEGGQITRSDEYVTPFERYLTFQRQGGLWKLKEMLPPAKAQSAVAAENVDEESSPEQVQWYYTKDRAL